MSSREQKFMDVMTLFLERITTGIENFKYKDKEIGTGIFLVNYIGKHQGCTMKDIADFLKVIPSTATRRIDKLVELELVTRLSSKSDRRLIKLKLTSEGEGLYSKFLENRFIKFNKMAERLKKEEMQTFFRVLEIFLEFEDDLQKLDLQ